MKNVPGGYKLSPNEEARLLKEAREERRKQRLIEVRKQAKQNAAKLRKAVKNEQDRQIQKLGEEIKDEWEKEKAEKIRNLEELYSQNISSVGEGHSNAALQEPAEPARSLLAEVSKQRASVRHQAALQKLRDDTALREEEEKRHIRLRQAALDAERERAAEVASRPPPPPDPVCGIEPVKVRPVQFTDIDAFSSTHYHIPEVCHVEKAQPESQDDARQSALTEAEKHDHETDEQKRQVLERKEKAILRHRAALKKELLKHEYNDLLHDLSDLQRADRERRQNVVQHIPKQIFLPPHRRVEEKEDRQRDMENDFEDMYMAATEFYGDLSLALDPHPPPDTPSVTDVLELSVLDSENKPSPDAKDQDQSGGVTTQPSRGAPMLRDVTNQPLGKLLAGRDNKQTPDGLRRLLSRIKSQRDQWSQKSESIAPEPERDTRDVRAPTAAVQKDGAPPSLSQYTLTTTAADDDDVTTVTITTGDTESTVPSSVTETQSSLYTESSAETKSEAQTSLLTESSGPVITLPEPPARRETLSSGTLTESLSEGTLTPSSGGLALRLNTQETLLHPLEVAERSRQPITERTGAPNDPYSVPNSVPDDLSGYLAGERRRQEAVSRDAARITEETQLSQQLLAEQRAALERRLAEIDAKRTQLTSELSLRQSQNTQDASLPPDSQHAPGLQSTNHVTFAPLVESMSRSWPANQATEESRLTDDIKQHTEDMYFDASQSIPGRVSSEQYPSQRDSYQDQYQRPQDSASDPMALDDLRTQLSGYFTQSNLPDVTSTRLPQRYGSNLTDNVPQYEYGSQQYGKDDPGSLPFQSIPPSQTELRERLYDRGFSDQPLHELPGSTSFSSKPNDSIREPRQAIEPFKFYHKGDLQPTPDQPKAIPLKEPTHGSFALHSPSLAIPKPYQSLPDPSADPRSEYQRQLLMQHRGRFEELSNSRQRLAERAEMLLDSRLGGSQLPETHLRTSNQLFEPRVQSQLPNLQYPKVDQSLRNLGPQDQFKTSQRSQLSELGPFQDVDVSGSAGNLSGGTGEAMRPVPNEETKSKPDLDRPMTHLDQIQALKEKWMRDFLQTRISDTGDATRKAAEDDGKYKSVELPLPPKYGGKQFLEALEDQNKQNTDRGTTPQPSTSHDVSKTSTDHNVSGRSWHQKLMETSAEQSSIVRDPPTIPTDPQPLVFEIEGSGSPPMIRRRDALEKSGRMSSTPNTKSSSHRQAESLDNPDVSLSDHTSWVRSMEPEKRTPKLVSKEESSDDDADKTLEEEPNAEFQPLQTADLSRDASSMKPFSSLRSSGGTNGEFQSLQATDLSHDASSLRPFSSLRSSGRAELSQYPLTSAENTRYQARQQELATPFSSYHGDLSQYPLTSAEATRNRFSAASDDLSQYRLSMGSTGPHGNLPTVDETHLTTLTEDQNLEEGTTSVEPDARHLPDEAGLSLALQDLQQAPMMTLPRPLSDLIPSPREVTDDDIARQVELSLARHRSLMARTQEMMDANSSSQGSLGTLSQGSLTSSAASLGGTNHGAEDRRSSHISNAETGISDEPDLTLLSLGSSGGLLDHETSLNVQHGAEQTAMDYQTLTSYTTEQSMVEPKTPIQARSSAIDTAEQSLANYPLSEPNQGGTPSNDRSSSSVADQSSLLSFERHEESVTDLTPRRLWDSKVEESSMTTQEGELIDTEEQFSALQPDSYHGNPDISSQDETLASAEESNSGAVSLQEAFLRKKQGFVEASEKRRQEVNENRQEAEQKASSGGQQGAALGRTLASWKRSRGLNTAASSKPVADPSSIPDIHTSADRGTDQKENKARTQRLYNKLEEVKKQKVEKDRQKFYTDNREKAKEYAKKQQAQRKKKQERK